MTLEASTAGLTFQQAELKVSEIERAFDRVQKNYKGVCGRIALWRGEMRPADVESITNCIDALIALSKENPVQEQLRHVSYNDSLYSRVEDMKDKILFCASKFRKTKEAFLGRYY